MITAQCPYGTEPQPFACLHAADGIRLRYGLWSSIPATCRGTVFVLAGRSEYMEKYREVIQELNVRGFDVISFDWRGQGLSQRLLTHPTKGYVDSFDHYLTDLDSVLNKALPHCQEPLMLMAHSMGGHLALRYLHRRPETFSKAVLCAPMIDINTAPMPKFLARLFSRWLRRSGFARAVIAGAAYFDPYRDSFQHNRLTSDTKRFERMQKTIADTPALVAPHVTNGWLAAAFDSIDMLRRPGFGNGIHTPLLIVAAGYDQIVVNRATVEFAAELPTYQMMVIQDARHEILQERDTLRTQFWKTFDAFIADRATPREAPRSLFPDSPVALEREA